MEFREIKITTTTEGIDIVTGALSLAGLQNFVIEDAADFREFLETNTPRWDYIEESLLEEKQDGESAVKLYLTANAQGEKQLEVVKEVLKGIKERDKEGLFGTLELEVGTVREEDWENNWKAYFKPFRVGERFLIKPSWEEIEDDEGRTVLEIDPASSFGTGTHATTQLCIEAMEKLMRPGVRFCDLGCGSGILTLCAHLLNAGEMTSVDIDENAVAITESNLARIGACSRTFVGDVTDDPILREEIGTGYDVVAANIVADVLLAIMPFIKSILNEGAHAILSGIIFERQEEIVKSARENGLAVLEVHEKDDWASVLVRK